jgi:hypothetical protein
MKTLLILLLTLISPAEGSLEKDFSIEREFGARKLAEIFEKKYKMNLKIKRKNGDLIVSIGDQGFFTEKGRITKSGARFVRKVSYHLCKDSNDCRVELKAHHFEEGYTTRRDVLKKSQYKLTAVAPQIFSAEIQPLNVLQIAAGDTQPLKNLDKNEYVDQLRLAQFNTRFEIKFALSGDEI